MAISVQEKGAVVTGGGSGINLAFVKLLIKKGYSVLIADLKLLPEAEELLRTHPLPSPDGTHPGVLFVQTNVASWPQLTSMWHTALDKLPSVDVVVPGAGLFEPEWSSFWEAPRTATNSHTASRDDAGSDPGHYATLDVNLVAPIRLSQLAVGHWTRNKQRGCLVHVGSMAGYTSGINTPLYFASKHGLHGFVRSLGGLRDRLGIRVGCVAPGSVRTSMWSSDPSKAAMLGPDTPLIEPEEIAEGMWRLVVDEDLGNGTIFEVSKGKTRVVPLFDSPAPTGEAILVPGYVAAGEVLYEKLKRDGLDT